MNKDDPNPRQQALLTDLQQLLGDSGLLRGHDLEPHTVDWRGRYRGDALCVVKPANREQVAAVVRLCAAAQIPIIPQGGNTGLSGAAVPLNGASASLPVIVNLQRLRRIHKVDTVNNTLEADAGCTVAEIQAAAAAAGRLYPVSFGADGSAQIGGSVATNAGGTAVLRYGNTRDQILGLEVVLANGDQWDGLRTLRKDNSGYDLKQLFIGSEGTLGIVTGVALKLHPLPNARAVAWVSPVSVEAALQLLVFVQGQVGTQLSAFELTNRAQVEHVLNATEGLRHPLPQPGDWNLLIELSGAGADAQLQAQLEELLLAAHERGWLEDAALASSSAQCEHFWRLRHGVSEGNVKAGLSIVFDIAIPLVQVPAFLQRAGEVVDAQLPWARVAVTGHLGDGNIHFVVVLDRQRWNAVPERDERMSDLRAAIYDVAVALGGTWSAEHGIGSGSTEQMRRYKSPVELALMRAVKAALDPEGLFNPGKLLPLANASLPSEGAAAAPAAD